MPITLSSRSVRRTALAGAAATLSIALAACSASFSAPTSQPYQAAEGTNADSGSIHVRNMLVLADADGKGELHTVIVNDGTEDDTLVKLAQAPAGTADGTDGGWQPGTVTFSEPKQPLELKAGSSILLPPSSSSQVASSENDPNAAQVEPISVTGAKPGQMVNVTITFGKAAPISAYVPVLTDDHYSPTPASGE
ncbi:hypothetical protein AB0L70_23145 [Kribbella sp. NPDC051952]|uniref:hypothetical protein n=1 Tax=Kribbella sp. NPDC051952 TaxID=3154851 RepID=UPI00342280F7